MSIKKLIAFIKIVATHLQSLRRKKTRETEDKKQKCKLWTYGEEQGPNKGGRD